MSVHDDCCAATSAYRAANPTKPRSILITKHELAHFKNNDAIRVYFGIENGAPVFPIVGADDDGNGNYNDVDIETNIVKNERPCPTLCGGPNSLNT